MPDDKGNQNAGASDLTDLEQATKAATSDFAALESQNQESGNLGSALDALGVIAETGTSSLTDNSVELNPAGRYKLANGDVLTGEDVANLRKGFTQSTQKYSQQLKESQDKINDLSRQLEATQEYVKQFSQAYQSSPNQVPQNIQYDQYGQPIQPTTGYYDQYGYAQPNQPNTNFNNPYNLNNPNALSQSPVTQNPANGQGLNPNNPIDRQRIIADLKQEALNAMRAEMAATEQKVKAELDVRDKELEWEKKMPGFMAIKDELYKSLGAGNANNYDKMMEHFLKAFQTTQALQQKAQSQRTEAARQAYRTGQLNSRSVNSTSNAGKKVPVSDKLRTAEQDALKDWKILNRGG